MDVSVLVGSIPTPGKILTETEGSSNKWTAPTFNARCVINSPLLGSPEWNTAAANKTTITLLNLAA